MSSPSSVAQQAPQEDTAQPAVSAANMAQESPMPVSAAKKTPFLDFPTLADQQLGQDQAVWDNAAAQMWLALDPWATQMVNESVETRVEKGQLSARGYPFAQREASGEASGSSSNSVKKKNSAPGLKRDAAALAHDFNKATGFPDWVNMENPSHWMFWALEEEEALAPNDGLFTRSWIRGGVVPGAHSEHLTLMGSAGTPADLPRGPALAAAALASGIMSVELSRLHQGLGVGARAWAIWTLLETTDFLDAMQAEGSFKEHGVLSSPRALAAREALGAWAKARAESAATRDARAMASHEEQTRAEGARSALTMQEAIDWALSREEIRKGMDNLRINQLFNWRRGEQLWRKAVVRVERDELDEAVASARHAVLGPEDDSAGRGEGAAGEESGKRGGRRL